MKKIGDITNTADKNGEFTDGNVAAGTPPTQLMGAWFNSVQREILNVLTKAGVPQSATKEDQLAEAISTLINRADYQPSGSYLTTDNVVQSTGESLTDVMSQKAVTEALQSAVNLDTIYPVGIVTWFAQNKDPNTLFPGTQWQYIGENKTIRLANSSGSNVLATGGSDTVTLTETQLPSHNHTFSASTSSFDYGTKSTNTTGSHNHSVTADDSGSGSGNFGRGNGNRRAINQSAMNMAGDHAHTVSIGTHSHTVSGTTGNKGNGSAITITNAYVMLMAWYRIS
ncbi:hypothetical protein AB7W42_10210 [Providencia rettgeri]